MKSLREIIIESEREKMNCQNAELQKSKESGEVRQPRGKRSATWEEESPRLTGGTSKALKGPD